MKTNYYLYPLFAIVFFAAMVLNSCKKECCKDPTNPQCENYDPCTQIKPAKADFGIFEVIGDDMRSTHILDETDTILVRNGAFFKPKSTQDKVTWILGGETVEQKELFRMGYPPGWIDVTMIAEMNPSPCLKEYELRDTLTKRFYVLQHTDNQNDSNEYKSWIWWGTWEGADTDAPDDKFTISWGFINGRTSPWIDFAGLPKGAPKQSTFYKTGGLGVGVPVHVYLNEYPGYKAILLSSDDGWGYTSGFGLQGVGKINNGVLEIEYKFENKSLQNWILTKEFNIKGDYTPEWVSKKWVGRKISNQVYTQ
jgi:hypothetical protein